MKLLLRNAVNVKIILRESIENVGSNSLDIHVYCMYRSQAFERVKKNRAKCTTQRTNTYV